MIACVDTHYHDTFSLTAVVLFDSWLDACASEEFIDKQLSLPAEYIPGQFFQRELPYILSAIERRIESIETIVIDGYVWLDANRRKGLGAVLYEQLEESVSVVGVAKKPFAGACGTKVYRGESKKPLFVTTAGMEESVAVEYIEAMHGKYRIPALLKRADHLARHGIDMGLSRDD